MKKLGSELEVGDVVAVNNDQFEVLSISDTPSGNSLKVYFQSRKSGRKYGLIVWQKDSFEIVA